MVGTMNAINTMSLRDYGFEDLHSEELLAIEGGVDWAMIGTGLIAAAAGMFAIVSLPATAFVGVAYAGVLVASALTGAGSGMIIAQGIRS